MALSASELHDLKARCRKAQATGFGVGKADSHLASLAAELGVKNPGPATPERLLALIAQVEDVRAGKPVKAAPVAAPVAPPPAPKAPPPEEEDEDNEDEEDEDEEDEKKSSPAASPRPKKPSGGSKKKKPTSKKR